MLVAENRTNEFTYNVQAIKNILFSGDTSSIHALEKLLNDTVQFDVLEQEVLDRQYIPKEAKSFFDKTEHFFTVYPILVIKEKYYLKISFLRIPRFYQIQ